MGCVVTYSAGFERLICTPLKGCGPARSLFSSLQKYVSWKWLQTVHQALVGYFYTPKDALTTSGLLL